MSFACYPVRSLEKMGARPLNWKGCPECGYRSYCEIYMLVMDLTAEREMCPVDKTKEYCPVIGEYLDKRGFIAVQKSELKSKTEGK